MIRPIKKMKHAHYISQQTGITLIELMVAMAVSSVIILGIGNIFVSTKKSNVIHEEFARIQENSRYTLETLSTNIRNAGFFGCSSGQGLGTITNSLNDTEDSAWNFETGLMGYEADGTDIGDTKVITTDTTGRASTDWDTAAGLTSGGNAIAVNPEAAITNLALPGSDILIVRTTDDTGVRIAGDNSSAQLFVEDTTGGLVTGSCPQNDSISGRSSNGISGICDGDVLLVSDCTKSQIFQTTGLSTGGGPGSCDVTPCFNLVHANTATYNPGNASPTWDTTETYGIDSEVMKLVTKVYFVGVETSGGEPSLYLRRNDEPPVPIVEGIENMQILYGVDSTDDGIVDRYFSANNVPDEDGDANTVFESVISVKLSLLARTPQDLPGLNRTPANYAGLTYNMVSPVNPIIIDPIAASNATATDRRMRKVFNLTVNIRNKSLNTITN